MAFSQDLADYQWNNRLLILVAKQGNVKAADQLRNFAKFEKDFKERDLLPLERTTGDSELLGRYDISAGFEGVLLIGKDGGLKLKKPFNIETKEVFELIDGMPMRRAEMKKY